MCACVCSIVCLILKSGHLKVSESESGNLLDREALHQSGNFLDREALHRKRAIIIELCHLRDCHCLWAPTEQYCLPPPFCTRSAVTQEFCTGLWFLLQENHTKGFKQTPILVLMPRENLFWWGTGTGILIALLVSLTCVQCKRTSTSLDFSR